jgi:hypothetical protein
MKLTKNLLILSLTSMLFITTACEDNDGHDHDHEAESATISGTITVSGDWPSTGTVYLSLFNEWPSTGTPYKSETITEAGLVDNAYTYTFTNVTFGTYPMLSVSWLDPEDSNPATNQHTKGYYADEITVSSDNHEVTGIDFTATF